MCAVKMCVVRITTFCLKTECKQYFLEKLKIHIIHYVTKQLEIDFYNMNRTNERLQIYLLWQPKNSHGIIAYIFQVMSVKTALFTVTH